MVRFLLVLFVAACASQQLGTPQESTTIDSLRPTASDWAYSSDDRSVLFANLNLPTPTSELRKWEVVLSRHAQQLAELDRGCESDQCEALGRFQDEITRLSGVEDPWDRIREVNTTMNSSWYVADSRVGIYSDSWATPAEFLYRGGDCEDYAIAKYLLLRSLGFDATDLRIAVVYDLEDLVIHAVLVVWHEGIAYVLDNYGDEIVPAHQSRRYVAYYVVNEDHVWEAAWRNGRTTHADQQ